MRKAKVVPTLLGSVPVKIEGAALLSNSAKSSTDGLLRFGAPRELHNADTFDVGYGIALAG